MEGTHHGEQIAAQLLDVAVRVSSVRHFTVQQMVRSFFFFFWIIADQETNQSINQSSREKWKNIFPRYSIFRRPKSFDEGSVIVVSAFLSPHVNEIFNFISYWKSENASWTISSSAEA